MSRENVEIIRAGFDAVNRQDFDAALRHVAPDFELDMSRAIGMDRGVFNLDEWRRIMEEFADGWESSQYEIDELVDAGDHVVTIWTNHLRGRDGIEVQAHGTWVWTFRDGAVVRCCLYQEREEALAAAGLAG
jgi:ketosteroid isomerase-like protein